MSEAGGRSAWDSPGFLLWHATLRWQRAVAAALRPLGLTHVQFVLLAGGWWLSQGDRWPSQRELADHAGTDRMMTSQVVRTLERQREREGRAPPKVIGDRSRDHQRREQPQRVDGEDAGQRDLREAPLRLVDDVERRGRARGEEQKAEGDREPPERDEATELGPRCGAAGANGG